MTQGWTVGDDRSRRRCLETAGLNRCCFGPAAAVRRLKGQATGSQVLVLEQVRRHALVLGGPSLERPESRLGFRSPPRDGNSGRSRQQGRPHKNTGGLADAGLQVRPAQLRRLHETIHRAKPGHNTAWLAPDIEFPSSTPAAEWADNLLAPPAQRRNRPETLGGNRGGIAVSPRSKTFEHANHVWRGVRGGSRQRDRSRPCSTGNSRLKTDQPKWP